MRPVTYAVKARANGEYSKTFMTDAGYLSKRRGWAFTLQSQAEAAELAEAMREYPYWHDVEVVRFSIGYYHFNRARVPSDDRSNWPTRNVGGVAKPIVPTTPSVATLAAQLAQVQQENTDLRAELACAKQEFKDFKQELVPHACRILDMASKITDRKPGFQYEKADA